MGSFCLSGVDGSGHSEVGSLWIISFEDALDDGEEGYNGDPGRLGVGVEFAEAPLDAVDEEVSE